MADIIYRNIEKWNLENNHVLLIVGVPSSGKSTLADQLSVENNADVIHLDFLADVYTNGLPMHCRFPRDIHYFMKAFIDLFSDEKYGNLDNDNDPLIEYRKTNMALRWICERCNNINRLAIIEGVQIGTANDPFENIEFLKDFPMMILYLDDGWDSLDTIHCAFQDWKDDIPYLGNYVNHFEWSTNYRTPSHMPTLLIVRDRPNWITNEDLEKNRISAMKKIEEMQDEYDGCRTMLTTKLFHKAPEIRTLGTGFTLAHIMTSYGIFETWPELMSSIMYIECFETFRILFVSDPYFRRCRSFLLDSMDNAFIYPLLGWNFDINLIDYSKI